MKSLNVPSAKLVCLLAIMISALSLHAEMIPVKLKEGAAPHFPEELKDSGVEGEAKIRATIDETGVVTAAEVESATQEAFGLAALETVKTWIFEPATKDGTPVPQTVTIPLQFKLNWKDKLNAQVGRKMFVNIDDLTDKVHTYADIKKWIPIKGKVGRRVPYPEAMKGSGISEEVAVILIISPEGLPLNPALENLQNKELALPVIRHVANVRFQPPVIDGKPVYLKQKVKFICSEDPAFGQKKK
ncbi:MAG TPA: TonB family protein [Oceanipulchritudo sp.]|nr:TonB family protein [Oceanipulchritudo sp.]